jgi:hyperosmotically inducible protein
MNKLTLIFALLAALTTAGCAGLGGGSSDGDGGSSAASLGGGGRGGPKVPDSDIVATIKAAFKQDDQLAGASIDVTANNGVVTLSGSVPNAQAYNRAISLARGAPGVRPPVNAANLKF